MTYEELPHSRNEPYSHEQMMESQKDSRVAPPTIQMRLDSIDTLLETLHKATIEFEGQVAPVLHQEPPSPVREESIMTATDDSAVVSQRLASIQRRIAVLIEEMRNLQGRVEL